MNKIKNKNITAREFFKLTLFKIILTAIIFILILIILGTPQHYELECSKTACGAFLYFIGVNIDVSKISGEIISLMFLIIYLIEIAASYLISCLIAHAYKKFKSKK